MFINFSNHPSKNWNKEQLAAAGTYGEIVDISFPQVPAYATEQEIEALAQESVQQILIMKPDCVLCQGEFCLAYRVIELLKDKGIKVVAACSEREVEEVNEGDTVKKISHFTFVKFREY